MALRVVLRRQAAADIESIADYIAAESPRKARAVSDRLRERCRSLGRFPEQAAIYRGQVRRLVVAPYLMFYRLADPQDPELRRVIVLRVLHGARDTNRLLDPNDE